MSVPSVSPAAVPLRESCLVPSVNISEVQPRPLSRSNGCYAPAVGIEPTSRGLEALVFPLDQAGKNAKRPPPEGSGLLNPGLVSLPGVSQEASLFVACDGCERARPYLSLRDVPHTTGRSMAHMVCNSNLTRATVHQDSRMSRTFRKNVLRRAVVTRQRTPWGTPQSSPSCS